MKKKLFSNIIGYNDTKKTLERIIDVLNNQEKYKKLGATIPHGLFMYGPPGLGKTTFANEVLDNVVNRKKYIIRKTLSDGTFIKHMKNIFNEAKKNQPSIILLDDIDKFSEDDGSKNNEEFVAVQSFIDDIKNQDVFVIATANYRYMLPDSLIRSGRFDIKIKIEYPKAEDSFEILNHFLKRKKISSDVNIENISYILECSSCADLEKVCNQAGIYAGFNNKDSIGMEELLRAALENSYGTNIEDINKDDPYTNETAYHEAGHALVGSILEPNSIAFVSVAKTDSCTKGITKYHNNEYYFDNIDFMKNRLTTLLAGKAALEIMYNKCDTGVYSDLDRAYKIAERFVNDYCFIDFNSNIRNEDIQSEKVKQNRDENINKIIAEYYLKAKELLIANKSKLELLAIELTKKKILFKNEIQDIIF